MEVRNLNTAPRWRRVTEYLTNARAAVRQARPLSAGILLGLALTSFTANATVFVPATARELVAESDAVVMGDVVAIDHQLSPSGVPWTRVTLAIVDVLAGEVEGSRFAFRCAGGPVIGRNTVIAGTPVVGLRDRVIVLFREANALCQVSGWERGLWQVRTLSDGRTTVLNGGGHALTGVGPEDLEFGSIDRGSGVEPAWESEDRVYSGEIPPFEPLLDELRAFFSYHAVSSRPVRGERSIVGPYEPPQPAASPAIKD